VGRHLAGPTRHLAEVEPTVRGAAAKKRRPAPSTPRYPAVPARTFPEVREYGVVAYVVVAAVTLAIADVPPVTVPAQTMTGQTHPPIPRPPLPALPHRDTTTSISVPVGHGSASPSCTQRHRPPDSRPPKRPGAFGHSAIGSIELCRWFVANSGIPAGDLLSDSQPRSPNRLSSSADISWASSPRLSPRYTPASSSSSRAATAA
jgi:hypothetical protein